jgi:gliding motility-associated-like protein
VNTRCIYLTNIGWLILHLLTGVLYAHLPNAQIQKVRFFINKNQWPEPILFRADIPDGALFIEENQLTYNLYDGRQLRKIHKYFYNHPPSPETPEPVSNLLNHHAWKVSLLHAQKPSEIQKENISSDYRNYFIGKDPKRWASEVKAWGKIIQKDVYPNTDWIIHSNDAGLKHDFVIHPGGSPGNIQLNYSGQDSIVIHNQQLLIYTSVHTLIEAKPIAWQWVKGKQVFVPCQYVLNKNVLSFEFPEGFDSTLDLILDPTVVFSTFSGSTADNWGFTATYDTSGNLYSGGTIYATGFPVTVGAFQQAFAGGPPPTGNMPVDNCDMAILKYNGNGNQLMFATYLGGFGGDYPHSLFVNENNELHIMGTTGATDFPVTPGSFDPTHNGAYDIVVVKMNQNGTALLASTFVGGSGHDGINNTAPFSLPTAHPLHYQYADDFRGDIQSDAAGNIFVITSTQSANFPTTPGAFQTAHNGGLLDACVFKLNPSLSTMLWSSFVGGSSEDAGYSIVLVPDGSVYISGGTSSPNFPVGAGGWMNTFQGGRSDGFALRLSATGNSILSGTFLGTTDYDQAYFIQRDAIGNIYLCGQSAGGTYPTANTSYSIPGGGQFITKLNANLSAMTWSSSFGLATNTPSVSPTAFLVDQCGYIYFAGWGGLLGNGNTTGLPVTSDAFQSTTDGKDFYLCVFEKDISGLFYATFIGGNVSQDHVDGGTSRFDKRGIVYHAVCGGCGGMSDFPTTPGVWSNNNLSTNCNNAAFKIDFGLANYPPNIVRPSVTGIVGDTLFFTAGSQTCYDFVINDNNLTDSLTAYPGGDLFGQGTMPAPFAVSVNDSGPTPLTVQICWTPTCDQATQPWLLPLFVRDNTACPVPLTASDTMFARILPDPVSPPEIRCVSVTGPNQISLTWINPPTVTGFYSYYIFRNDGTGWVLLDSVMNVNQSTYTDNSVTNTYSNRYAYRLSTCRECPGRYQSDPGTEAISSLCDAYNLSSVESQVSWNEYPVWANPTYTIEVNSNPDFILHQNYGDTSTTYLNCDFRGRFRTFTQDPVTGCTVFSGYSPVVEHKDTLPEPPEVCRVTVVEGDIGIRLDWKPDYSAFLGGYKIYRKILGIEDQFSLLNEIPSNLVNSYEDRQVEVDNNRYCYVLAAMDRCGQEVIGKDTSCSILLRANAVEYASEIDWSDYIGWGNLLDRYEVWMAPETYKFYVRIFPGEKEIFKYTDRDIFRPQPMFCYRVKAMNNPTECGTESWSNENCIEFTPLLHTANAFSPNGDGINDFFIVSHYFINNYHLLIFDRWGNLIFESFDKGNHWTGSNDGQACPEGVYIYVVEGTGYNGQVISKNGTVTLIR